MTFTREQVEDFLYLEADLMDQWKLIEWSELFAENGQYLVPPIGYPDADPNSTLFLIADDRFRLIEQAKRLMKRTAHVEYPHSTTRHMISNVRIEKITDGVAQVKCNFVAYRTKRQVLDVCRPY
ncbi:aromatic-ring-hydroxylating dioxygenase subunit beta [Effusibacillus dendaii]|uniref:p-cumate dioxygenase n=1 Tax=Effusibacillus dendaii TaxID=2743772 RepID=A0A7I8D542_9BACL|nr:aromatic-ring-hydroxylating dioxygenase subunit beta [Effusibacillus dendaii]BCJ85214.1 hypothetical protein skT53_01990 [Effusibacillus dendaii]